MGSDHKKRIKMTEYFRVKISNDGFMFLQEIHFSEDTFKIWHDDFRGECFFHGTTNSHVVIIGFLGKHKRKKIKTDVNGTIKMEAHFDEKIFVLINLWNSNIWSVTEKNPLRAWTDVRRIFFRLLQRSYFCWRLQSVFNPS